MTFLVQSALMAQQWEIAKGHLRAMVGLAGAVSSIGEPRFIKIEAAIEKFIKDFEDEAFHEGED